MAVLAHAHIFQSTPSPRRETYPLCGQHGRSCYFNPLPPQGGRLFVAGKCLALAPFQSTPSPRRETTSPPGCTGTDLFQSTPSPRRETKSYSDQLADLTISIHSLPKEGDSKQFVFTNFTVISIHSLPKEGDRQRGRTVTWRQAFQSTPSPRRETELSLKNPAQRQRFQSTPSPRRETWHTRRRYRRRRKFQSTPSPRRETPPS